MGNTPRFTREYLRRVRAANAEQSRREQDVRTAWLTRVAERLECGEPLAHILADGIPAGCFGRPRGRPRTRTHDGKPGRPPKYSRTLVDFLIRIVPPLQRAIPGTTRRDVIRAVVDAVAEDTGIDSDSLGPLGALEKAVSDAEHRRR